MPDQPSQPSQPTPEELAQWNDVKTRLLRIGQDLEVVLEELRIAQVDINTTTAESDCCCCCTPGSCCTGAAAVPIAAAV